MVNIQPGGIGLRIGSQSAPGMRHSAHNGAARRLKIVDNRLRVGGRNVDADEAKAPDANYRPALMLEVARAVGHAEWAAKISPVGVEMADYLGGIVVGDIVFD